MAETQIRLNQILSGAEGYIAKVVGGVVTWVAASSGIAHTSLSATHTDTLADTIVDGDVLIGNATPNLSRLGISIPAANVRNVFAVDNGELRPSWKIALDATAPTTISEGAPASPGTSLVFAHRDHTHGAPATWAATAHAIDDATHTVAGRTAGQVLIATAATIFGFSGFLLDGTTGGKTIFSVSNTKTLTFIATNNFSLTIPTTGTAALLETNNLFTGNNLRLKQVGAGGIALSCLGVTGDYTITLVPGATLTGNHSVIFPDDALTFSTGGTLNLGGYTFTVPTTGTAALLGIANAFTADQTLSSGKFLKALTDGSSGGIQAGASSDVLFYRDTGPVWHSNVGIVTDGNLVRGSSVNSNFRFRTFTLANNAVGQFLDSAAPTAWCVIVGTIGATAIYETRGGVHGVAEISDWASAYTPTKGNAGTVNIYWDAGNARYEIENKFGSSLDFYIFYFSST